MRYNVYYSFDGYGSIEIEAKSKEEAEELFLSGHWGQEEADEDGGNYEIESVEEIK